MDESDLKTTGLKKAYAEIILNTAKESAARVMVSGRKSARFHHDLSETKGEALRLLVRLKHMIDAKTIEADVISSNQQRQIDVLEAQLHEAEDIITDLRSEVRWLRDRLEKAKAYEFEERDLANNEEEEEETVSVQKVVPEVVVESLNPDQDDSCECENMEKSKASELQERNLVNIEEETVSVHEVVVESLVPDQEAADACFFAKTLDVECGNDVKHFDGFSVVDTLQAYESQERNVVNMEEEEEETVSVHKVYPEAVLECLNLNQEDHSSLDDVEYGNLEKEEEEETVSAHKVDQEVVLESVNLNQEDHNSLDDVECGNLEKAKAYESQERNLVNKEEEMVSAHKVDEEVVVESLKPDEEVAHTCFSLKLHDVDCENDEKHFDGSSVGVDTVMGNDVCESESNGDIRIKKLELSRNGCTHRIHALERVALEKKSSSSENEEEQEGTTEKESEESLSSGKSGTLKNTRCLVLALRASTAEVVTLPSNALGIKKTSKRRRKRRFGKPKAKSVRTQSHHLIKPCCQSQSNATCSKTSTSDGEDSTETHLSVESKEVLVDVLVSCEGEEDSVVPSTKMASSLVNLHSDSKVTAVVSGQISESPPRANVNRFLKYTFQRKRKRGSANLNEDSTKLPRKHQEKEAQDQN